MIRKIRKRDGSVVPFQQEKIAEAIWKAVKAVGGTDKKRTEYLSGLIEKELEKKHGESGIPDVEDVQDTVEKLLIEEGHAKVAKAYILYRKSHEELRYVKGLFDTIEVVDDYIGLNDWMVKENSNMAFSLQGLNNYISTKIIGNYWIRRIYPEAIRHAHESADLHVHDLGTLGAYCVGWDLKDLLMTGFRGVSGKLVCKPPKHFRSALGQIVNFFYTLQGESAGAQAFSVHPKETVIVMDDKQNISIKRIGNFTDGYVEKYGYVKGELEIADISKFNLKTLSFDKAGCCQWKRINKVIRHSVTDPLHILKTNKGIK